MSHTNHTQYYELPQYVGSDIINPLVDTNGAYETIDTTMHNIAAEAAQDTADVAALQSKVGSGVFDTTAQNATDAVNELVGELNTADTGVKARLSTAENDIDTLQSQMVTAQGNITDLQNNKANASDVNALETSVNALETSVDALETTVGDANSGLVKSVSDLNNKANHSHNSVISVRGDGVKTNSEILDELFAQLKAVDTKREIITAFIYITNVGGANLVGVDLNEHSTKTEFRFNGVNPSLSNTKFLIGTLKASGSDVTGNTIDTNGWTLQAYTGAVLADGAAAYISYDYLETI